MQRPATDHRCTKNGSSCADCRPDVIIDIRQCPSRCTSTSASKSIRITCCRRFLSIRLSSREPGRNRSSAVIPLKLVQHVTRHMLVAIFCVVLIHGCLGGAAVQRWTRDRKIAGSTPGRGAIKSTRSTQPSTPSGSVNRVPACMAAV